VRGDLKGTGNIEAAAAVGKAIAERQRRPASRRSRSIAPVTSITVASRRWPMQHVKTGLSSKSSEES